MPSIVVCGVGGAGGYFGGRLALSGEDVVFVARGQHLDAIRERGLRVSGARDEFVVYPAQVTDDCTSFPVADFVILAVKTWQVEDALAMLRPVVGPGTKVVPLQNGVETPRLVARTFGDQHAMGGLAKIVSYIAGPGHIHHMGLTPELEFGELSGRRSDAVETLLGSLERAGIAARVPGDIRTAMWEKFLRISSWGGLAALANLPIGVLCRVQQTRELLRCALAEVAQVGRAHQVELPDNTVDNSLAYLDGVPPDSTASVQRDLAEGRRSEIEAWSGAVVRLGREVGVPTPIHDVIYGSLLPRELRNRGLV